MNVSDVNDTDMREALAQAEAALDEGQYATAVHSCVAAYGRLIDLRPDMIIAPRIGRGAPSPQAGSTPPPAGGGVGAGGLRPWPSDHGVRFAVEDGGKPALTFAKEHFTLSEAATYFEYTLDMVLRAQRRPAQET